MFKPVAYPTLKVPSVAFLPSSALAVYASGRTSGLVVDCGHEETRVLPMFQGVPLLNCYQCRIILRSITDLYLDHRHIVEARSFMKEA